MASVGVSSGPLRILRIADVVDNRTGGMARIMHFTAEELRQAGDDVELCFADGIGTRVSGRLRRLWAPLRVVQIVRQRAKKGGRFDVVEIHEPIAFLYVLLRRLFGRLPPVLVFSYGIEARSHQILLDFARKAGRRPSLKERYGRRFVDLWQSRFALRRADGICVQNAEDVDYLVSNLHVPRERITIVPSAVSRAFLEQPSGPSPGCGVLFLASWIERKGVKELVAIFTELLRQDLGVKLTVAGVNCDERVVRDAFPASCRDKIAVVPRIQGEQELVALYRRHSIYLLRSAFEGQPLTMLEAAASGLAIVCSNVCGMKDFVRDGVNGLLAGVGDGEALLRATLELVQNANECARLGAQAQCDARKYTWNRSAMIYRDAAERIAPCTRCS